MRSIAGTQKPSVFASSPPSPPEEAPRPELLFPLWKVMDGSCPHKSLPSRRGRPYAAESVPSLCDLQEVEFVGNAQLCSG